MINIRFVPRVADGVAPAGFRVSDGAIRDARAIGLCGDVALRLARMARRSAPLTDERGNRRFDDFVLMVKDREVLSVDRL